MIKKLSKSERKKIKDNYLPTAEQTKKLNDDWDTKVVMSFEDFDVSDEQPLTPSNKE